MDSISKNDAYTVPGIFTVKKIKTKLMKKVWIFSINDAPRGSKIPIDFGQGSSLKWYRSGDPSTATLIINRVVGDHLSWYVTRTFWSGVVMKWNFRTWEKFLCEFMEIASGKIPRTEEIDIPNPNLIYLYTILYPNRSPLEILLWAKI